MTSQARYYNIQYLPQAASWLLITSIVVLVISTFLVFVKRTHVYTDATLFFLIGVLGLFWNGIKYFWVIDTNFDATILCFLIAPAVMTVSLPQCRIFFISVATIIASHSALTYIDASLTTKFNPIMELRYYFISEQSALVRLQHNSLFGQKNAAGATLSLLILGALSLWIRSRAGISLFFKLVVIALILVAGMTFSAAAILIVFFGIVLLNHQRITARGIGILLCLALSAITFSLTLDPAYITRKIESLNAKMGRWPKAAEFFANYTDVFFVGKMPETPNFYSESAFIDLIVNFGITLPLLLMSTVVIWTVMAMRYRRRFESFCYLSFIALMAFQNSSLMPPCVLALLLLRTVDLRSRRSKIAASSSHRVRVACG